ncbi:MAG: preprotein translocase subunit SecA [Dehalococcoidia bacterium]|nr:preprotein translocase subunit SecA [Dehalococcoidia bacterium]
MFKKLTGFLSGDSNERELKRLLPAVSKINALEADFEKLSNDELKAKTSEFKQRLASRESLDDLLPEAFAAVREAAKRTLGQRHYDVQLMGGMVLHQGKIAEMKTGEGKTLVATLPTYLNCLTGKGVHVVTVNDYLSKRDPQWMGPIYHALGVSVGCIQHESAFLFDPENISSDPAWPHLKPVPRRQAYEVDITYGTNNEFGFDYLRDNMVGDLSQRSQRGFNYAIVDEVDNILIDEARTPLIISGQAEEATSDYVRAARAVRNLRGISEREIKDLEKQLGKEAASAKAETEYDYIYDEKARNLFPTVRGQSKIAAEFGDPQMYGGEERQKQDPAEVDRRLRNIHHAEAALKAKQFFLRDREYVVKDGEIIIVDEFTGRMMQGRRYSEGLHQAIEAKEGVKIQRENVTLATVTFQNYFRMYAKLAGMTGTAVTEAEEFHKIYKLEVVVVPTNKPLIRKEYQDQIYKNQEAKFRAVAKEIEEHHKAGQPVLVGTVAIETSEQLSNMLIRKGVPHQVLNAKQHEKEAGIIAEAGRPGKVTIATNMAGRGVDIILGGRPPARENFEDENEFQQKLAEWKAEHEKVIALGGLHIVGTERHEARRIDNQLRGRAGRQGDPGSSRFYVSLDDDIMRRFGGDRIVGIMDRLGFDEDTPIEHSLVTKAIENTQVKVESHHFDVRKHLLDYDDVLNMHRETIYGEREKILSGADLKANIQDMIKQEISNLVYANLADEYGDNWNLDGLLKSVGMIFPLPPDMNKDALSLLSRKEIQEKLLEHADSLYEQREQEMESTNMRIVERLVMLRAIDNHWREHLTVLENMRESIGLQAYAQKDPLVAYKSQSHGMFQLLQANIQRDIVHTIYHVGIVKESPKKEKKEEPVGVGKKIGRNDPCPCGSGRKYKKCCGTDS